MPFVKGIPSSSLAGILPRHKCKSCKTELHNGTTTIKKQICPHQNYNIHTACIPKLKKCAECLESRLIAVQLGELPKTRDNPFCSTICDKIAYFLFGLLMCIPIGYFVPRLYYRYFHGTPPDNTQDVFIGVGMSMLGFIVFFLSLFCCVSCLRCCCPCCTCFKPRQTVN